MFKIFVTKFQSIVSKKDNKGWVILDTVSESGEVKKNFISAEKFGTMGFDQSLVSNLSKGQLVPLSAVYDERGNVAKIEIAM
ncbi:MAG: hypothetical protein WCX69_04660 [Candidatus Paceibacterota bacterium]